ncbi:tRNA (adenine-N1)-methyltransferase [Candidatus Poriferisodalis sp.]|uniref:tRNA (adenine-N1)-methyltransferase n=1 Tax=Candidatus Poriferisodalis sp. TaxID=3101277 RepID=UPI003B02262F
MSDTGEAPQQLPPEGGAETPVGDLQAGETVLMIDSRQRRYLVALRSGGEFHTHAGVVAHDEIIGSGEGSQFRSGSGARFVAVRPTLADQVLKMPRGAQVIYPKDLGAIWMLADVRAGMSVFEAGVGSGALSATLLRSGALVTGYELREDFAERAAQNVAAAAGTEALDRYDVQLRDAYDAVDPPRLTAAPDPSAAGGCPGAFYDRAVLDIPEPWRVVGHLVGTLRRGGILVAYNPSVTQVQQLRRTLDDGPWSMIETVEVLHRSWHVKGASVRPDHRMVAHTGFLTSARLIGT